MATESQIGPYTRQQRLGKGGNATVWRATPTQGGDPVALKVLSRPTDPVAYKRFRREIAAVATLQQLPGVLPLIDHHLPERPDEADVAWLAMPVAELITDCLGDRPALNAVVQAIADLAETLAAVAALGMAHRDVKPGNLYCYQGRAAVGDLGLVQLPEQEALTTDARAVGPRNFHAPEMFTPAGTNGQPADVYSLAKTLWVLATAQRIPPLGEQRVDVVGPRLSDHVPHPDARLLDGLIERCTRWDPAARPSMADVQQELASWLRLQKPPAAEGSGPAAPADAARRILAIASPGLSEQERVKRTQAEAAAVWERPRMLAKHIGLGKDTVAKIWADHNLKPWQVSTFKVSNDPDFEAKLVDVVGLYLNPPARAVVFSFDEKTQCQAMDRTQPSLPMIPGRANTMTSDYKRNGTTDLFAAMNIATGEVLTHLHKGHTAKDVLRFFKQIDASVPRGLGVHVVLDNLSAHKAPEIQKWLAHKDRRRWHLHFTPTSSSWTNLIERWFKELTDRLLRRGVYTSVTELETAITVWAAHWNIDPKPFIWKATTEKIIAKVQRGRAALTRQTNTKTDH